MRMRILYVTSEVFPLAKTGGLADVSAALPDALSALNVDVRLLLPGYPQVIERAVNPREVARVDDLLGCGEVRLLAARLPDSEIPLWLVDCPALYLRGGGIYQDEKGNDWPDNALRFAMLNHIAAIIAQGIVDERWRPDVVHANDWHASLLPMLLSARGNPRPATLLTIHNLAYQGSFELGEFPKLGLPDGPQLYSSLEFYGRLSFLKAGIEHADALTTVSPTYAREILTPEFGCGLDGILRQRAHRLSGILNGADYRIWDPDSDPCLPSTYGVRRISGKHACKAALQVELGLEPSAETPLIVFTSRLAHQKMPDIVLEALPALLAEGAQLAVVAEGDAHYEARFNALAANHPRQVSVCIGYEEPLAHRALAGADILLHPSRYEPCGLTPIYAMRYGTVPIVRKSGGTADSVVDAIEQTLACETATGFSFVGPTADDLTACVRRTLEIYRQPIAWRKIQICAMRQDFGWKQPAQAYADLYRTLAKVPPGEQIEETEPEQEATKQTACHAA
jgi:starch synthase